jgi:hypothetical protein
MIYVEWLTAAVLKFAFVDQDRHSHISSRCHRRTVALNLAKKTSIFAKLMRNDCCVCQELECATLVLS